MVFGAFLWILIIASIPLLTSPEFVVREIRACCHHRIIVKCADKNFKIAIVQARYFASGPDEASVAAVIHSRIKYSSPLDDPRDFQQQDHQHHRFIPSSQPSVSLWDLDLKFAHELQKESVQLPFPVNTLPEWHPDHSSHASNRRRFFHYPRRPTIPPKFPSGSNFTAEKVLEMPLYETNFLDSSTIWNQPLFPIVQSESSESRSLLSSKYFSDTFQTDSPAKFRNKCLSYQTLMSSAVHRSSILPPQTQPSDRTTAGKPGWRFKDLRTYFNRRCSGKSECEVLLIQSNGQDEDFSRVCHLMPDGIIAVKYICFNSSIATSHSKCNVDVTPATEGFLMNPGYPHLYPGDLPCEFRLHVPQQKILLIFFDISIRTDQSKYEFKW
ncbi:Neuropilin-1 [Folsomia candida]|uniref:Neuropilin-1 n=1 Tax=Folsomia candida TaxID=158441 RepID=A0A226EW17_FOLCA|nr:Neuropilin-1 [Folsomia candida]